MECPTCNSKDATKNGFIHNRKQKYVCKDCGRQFVENPPNKRIQQQLWDMVDKLLLEKIPIAGISRVTEISEPWLFGWHLTAIPERLSGCMLGAAIMPVPRHYGNHCYQSTVNAPFVTLIFGLHMSRFFPKTDIEQLVKKAEKRTTLKGSILH